MKNLDRRSALKYGAGVSAATLLVAGTSLPAAQANTISIDANSKQAIDRAFAAADTIYKRPIYIDFWGPMSALDGFAQDLYINVVNYDKADLTSILEFRIDLPKASNEGSASARWMTRALSSRGYLSEVAPLTPDTKSYIWTVDQILMGVNGNKTSAADMVFGFGDGLTRYGRIKNAVVITPLSDRAPALYNMVGDQLAQDTSIQAYYEQARAAWRQAGFGYQYGTRAYPDVRSNIAFGESVDSRTIGNDCPSLLAYDHNGIF